MILLRANPELKQTFDKLIQTIKVPVKWTGLFAVLDNYIILQGEVRSLFFHFDSRKVVTNLIDLPVKEDEIQETGDNVRVQNVINMILYTFGKWGTIQGLKVEKNYGQLNQLFRGIMQELQIEPDYTPEYFRFYKNGIRITYEDVIQTALETKDETVPEAEEKGGLWHKLVWKKTGVTMTHVETTLQERRKGRLGSNFYMVGYLCPVCRERLHMVVYPMDKELRIETEEGGVLLARACACDHCNSFYTPRPKKLLAEGDVYTMQFGDDRKAYEDYLELLGRTGERISNYRCNEFADKPRHKKEEEIPLEEVCEDLPDYTPEELGEIAVRMEEGFYPDESVLKCEAKVKERRRHFGRTHAGNDRGEQEAKEQSIVGEHEKQTGIAGADRNKSSARREEKAVRQSENAVTGQDGGRSVRTSGYDSAKNENANSMVRAQKSGAKDGSAEGQKTAEEVMGTYEEQEEVRKKYEAKLKVSDRFSERQLRELKNQLKNEKKLAPEYKEKYFAQVDEHLYRQRAQVLAKKTDSCEGKNYALLQRVFEEVEGEDLPDSMKQPLLEKLKNWSMEQAKREVAQLVSKMSPHMDRAQYQRFMERIHTYGDVDLAPYEDKLKSSREAAERQEIANVVRLSRKITREDLAALAQKLRDGDFLPELVLPYMEKVEEKIRRLDEEAIAEICGDPMHMSFDDGIQAYEQLEQGEFLPDLKNNALEMLKKRLSKIKTDECELLVKKLEEELQEAGITDIARHHFYPARKVLLNQASEEETAVIDFAMASFAAGCGPFEYPVFVVDTSRNEIGREGIILTPDHLYYSTMLSAYGIEIPSIGKITAATGFLNKGLYVHQRNGTKTKIPYAVDTKELPAFAGVLDAFIRYLQEKPDSRNVDYLAREKHETICCFRCGFVYKGGTLCPKCGYKNNG